MGVYAITQPHYYTPVYYRSAVYYYSDGVYYQRRGSTYVVVPAPVGAVVASPPPTYETVTTTDSNNVTNNYYYANGTFYEETADPADLPTDDQWAEEQQAAAEAAKLVTDEQRSEAIDFPEDEAYGDTPPGRLADEHPEENYRVVPPPLGATVTALPEDAEEKTVGDDTFFVYAGTWYKPFYAGDDVIYMVSANPEEQAPGNDAPAEATPEPVPTTGDAES